MTESQSNPAGGMTPPESAPVPSRPGEAVENTAPASMPTVTNSTGALLRAARESQGLAVSDIANRLRMGAKQVAALENGDFSSLPTGTFLRGFVRNYAKTLNLAPDEVLAKLEADHASARPLKATPVVVPAQQNIKVPVPGGELATPKARVAIAALVVCLLFAAAWYWWEFVRPHRAEGGRAVTPVAAPAVADTPMSVPVRPPDIAPALGPALAPGTTAAGESSQPASPLPETVQQPAVPAVTEKSERPPVAAPAAPAAPAAAPAAKAPPTTSNAPATAKPAATAGASTAVSTGAAAAGSKVAASAGASGVLGFTFTGDSWVEVSDASGKLVLSRKFRAGDAEEVAGRPPFSVVIGNAQVTRMAYNGREYDLTPHTKLSVARVAVK
jgi:cytoskeleton protein RodZ